MILTPKNWGSFQHYKDRAPAWIKLHKGLMTDFAFNRLPLASRALAPMLWLLASEYEGGEITASMDEIAFRLHISASDLHESLSPLIDSGFFIASEVLAEPERTAIPEKEDIVKRTSEEKEPSSAKTRPSASPDFEELKRRYPRRLGDYKWKLAERKFNSLVKTGVPASAILAAAVRLTETHVKLGNIGTQFVPMPASWLNSEDLVDVAVDAFEGDKPIDWDAICGSYKKFGVWSKHAPGNSPDSSSCQCPPEILEKYGLLFERRDAPSIPRLKSMSTQ